MELVTMFQASQPASKGTQIYLALELCSFPRQCLPVALHLSTNLRYSCL